MVTRLSASDSSFYRRRTPPPRCMWAPVHSAQTRGGLSYETLLATVEHRLPQMPRLPAEGSRGDAGAGPAGLGRRPGLRHHLPHPAFGAARRRAATPSCTSWSPGWGRGRWTVAAAVGDVPVEGLSRTGWPSTPSRIRPSSTACRRWNRARRRRPLPAAAAVRRGHLDSGPRAQRPSPGGRRGGVSGGPSRRLGGCGPPADGSSSSNSAELAVASLTSRARWPAAPPRQPAEHHRLAQPPIHRRLRRLSGLPAVALALRLRRQRRGAVRHRAGALRNWLLSAGGRSPPPPRSGDGADVGVPDLGLDLQTGPGQPISEVAPFLVDLPVGEGNAVVRLSQIAHATESHSGPPAWSMPAASSRCPDSRHRRCTPWEFGSPPVSRPGCSTCS